MKLHKWKMGEPCPVCGANIPPTAAMMDHVKTHDPPTGMLFFQKVLYFHTRNHLSAPTAKEVKE